MMNLHVALMGGILFCCLKGLCVSQYGDATQAKRGSVFPNLTAETKVDSLVFHNTIPGQRLRILADTSDLLIGFAARTGFPQDPENGDYKGIAKTEFNFLTSENAMKWGNIQPKKGEYYWEEADAHVAFAEKNNMELHGHTIIWHNGVPNWLKSDWSRNEMIDILYEHIDSVLTRYKGKIKVWDVANEVISDGGGLRNTFWLKNIGPDYIELAFRRARQVDPNAKLIYNDYNIGWLNNKSNDTYNMLDSLIAKGVPIDGVGFQMHIHKNWNRLQSFVDNMQRFVDLGLEIYITELDITLPEGYSQADLEKQAKLYAAILDTCLNQPACKGFQTWGFTDRYTWRGASSAPLIFDENFYPKPAYFSMQKVLEQRLMNYNMPTSPSQFNASGASMNQIWLTWQGKLDNIDGFILSRIKDGSTEMQKEITGEVRSFLDTGLIDCSLYEYQLIAFNENGNSVVSLDTAFTTGPSEITAPINVQETLTSASVIKLSWDHESTLPVRFGIEMDDGNGFEKTGEVIDSQKSYSIYSLETNKKYSFRIRSELDCKSSAYSDILEVQTKPGGGFILTKIGESSDDAEENSDGSMDLNSNDLDIGKRLCAVRFSTNDLPENSKVFASYIQFVAKNPDSQEAIFEIWGERSNNAETFEKTNENISSRSKSLKKISWNVPGWEIGDKTDAQRTPDLTSIIDELVVQGWHSGNPLVFGIDGTGERSAKAYDFDNSHPGAQLYIDYRNAFQLNVLDGTGSGLFEIGKSIEITANVPAENMEFKYWTGDNQFLDDTAAVTTTGVMPAEDVELQAVYGALQTAINEKVINSRIYPNPFTRDVTIQLGDALVTEVIIYNQTGQVVAAFAPLEKEGIQRITWNGKDASGNNLAPGVYMVMLLGENQYEGIKIVKQR